MKTCEFNRMRMPAVAGLFYPRDVGELRQMVQGYVEHAPQPEARAFKAYVLPHAGYVYSGPVAGVGYSRLRGDAAAVRRIVLMGPAHRVAFRGVAVCSHDAFDTPLGPVPVDQAAIESIRDMDCVVTLDQAHRDEHSLEVHLPFLQSVLGDFAVVPLVVGDAESREVAGVLERLWGGPETRVVVSSDLSHYHDYSTACERDRRTATAIERLEPVRPEQACGAVALNGLLSLADRLGLKAATLELGNSGDTAGSLDRVVGYGAFGVG